MSSSEELAALIIDDIDASPSPGGMTSAYIDPSLQRVLRETVSRARLLPCPHTIYWGQMFPIHVPSPAHATVYNADILDTAFYVRSKLAPGTRIGILNAGNAYGAGGGAALGQRALEEDLCRRTNLLLSLYQYKAKVSTKQPEHEHSPYITDILYTPDVAVLADSNYRPHDPWPVSIITACAPRYDRVQKYGPVDQAVMSHKIQMIFSVAKHHNIRHLVLCALGCGAFNNDPVQCAGLFKYWMERYGKFFHSITFAVLSKKDAVPNNYEVFRSILTGVVR